MQAPFEIKPKTGDIDGAGNIVLEDGAKSIAAGIVIIHRSRLRRAKRFGWEISPYVPPVTLVAPHLVAVRRN